MKRLSQILSTAAAIAALTFSLAVRAQAQVETILYSFPSPGTNGTFSSAPLTLDRAGDLYGTSSQGGGSNKSCGNGGCGVVFELVRGTGGTWSEKVLHTFTGRTDGGVPVSPLIFDALGNLYGTTEYAGNTNGCKDAGYNQYGCGVVFELSPNGTGWKITVLYTFSGGTDGGKPVGGLARDAAGNLYGTTSTGGDLTCAGIGCGVVFKLSQSGTTWTETVLHTFENDSVDGGVPYSTPVLDPAGNLYGTTVSGGSIGCGTVFELSASNSWAETILHSFTCGTDGWNPTGPILLDSSGNVFGSTVLGGNSTFCVGTGCGVVYELSQSSGTWNETILTNPGNWDGYQPVGLAADHAGNLYYVGSSGGKSSTCPVQQGCGAVTKLTPATGGTWTATVVHRFAGAPDGQEPQATVTLDAAGNLFGTAPGGEPSYGIIYEVRQ
jgi:uncharacterized repeat protein (TIGR03803 family)